MALSSHSDHGRLGNDPGLVEIGLLVGGVLVTRCWIMPSRPLSDSGCVVAGANVGKRASVDALFR